MKQQSPTNSFAARFFPFLIAGLTIVLFIIGILIFSWILIIAAIVGLVLFIISSISAKFSKHAERKSFQEELDAQQKGRTIDYEDIDKKDH